MSVDLRLPKISGSTEAEQLAQIKSYLYQFVEQLNWALNTITPTVVEEAVYNGKKSDTGALTDQETAATFSAIKSLIIKSADIAEAYYEAVRYHIDGDYVATSDFGRFQQTTSADITANSQAITQAFTNIQSIETSVVNVASTLNQVTANIKTGVLYEDDQGNPVYGLEVGQRNIVDGVETFNKYARFTSNRLSFYDQNDTEVAYISEYKLYITNAQITGNITLGRYVVDTSDGLLFRWE